MRSACHGFPRRIRLALRRRSIEATWTTVLERLRITRDQPDQANAYANAQDFAKDLKLLRHSWPQTAARVSQNYSSTAHETSQHFWISLASLDIRQHARVHARVIAELSGGANPGEPGRITLPASPSEETRSLLEGLRAIADLKREFPPQAICSYVISGVSRAEDVFAVIWLAGFVGASGSLAGQQGWADLD